MVTVPQNVQHLVLLAGCPAFCGVIGRGERIMKIIKRNGSEVVFDIMKIISAVTRANNVVSED